MRIFEKNEIRDIIIAVIALTIILSFPRGFLKINVFLIYLLAVIIGFVFHELAHKFTAKKFGCYAEFKIWPLGLVLGFLITLVSYGHLKFAAPGAVVISAFRFGRWKYRLARLTLKETGIIAAAGPATNLLFAIIFIPFEPLKFLTFINSWLAFFNLLPIPPLDGSKVMAWKPWLWFLMISLSFLLILPNLI